MAQPQSVHLPDPSDTPGALIEQPPSAASSGGLRDRAIAAASNGIVLSDPRQLDCPLVYANEAFLRMTGYSEHEVLGQNCRFLQGPDTDPDAVREMHEAIHQERGCQVLILNYRKDGTTFWNEATISPVRDERGHLTQFIGIQADTTARHEADAERTRLLAQERARAESEALLNRIGQTIRTAVTPNQVLEMAVQALGEAIGADYCYYVAYDQDADTATVGPDWHREGVPTFAAKYAMSRFAVNRDPEYKAGHTQVVTDTSSDPATLALGIHALVRVPLISGVSMTALCVATVDGPRAWTTAEVSLVEAVATQTQSALAAVRVQGREHNIAEQLQSALQPPLPRVVPGLKLAKYYEVALEEAGVGGDFYDVFAVENGCTVLVLGDLSGKGLQAAAEVSTVRNMLRAFLYSNPILAKAVTDLNRVLVLNKLLSGFATLWVGRYDRATGELTYINMGQEPALLRRAVTGQLEQLKSTGPVLGAIEKAAYREMKITLSPGDALAVFSDGVTECGASRQQMLGIEGAMALLAPPFTAEETASAEQMAEAMTLRLIDGVDVASRGGVAKDDVCILVAVVD